MLLAEKETDVQFRTKGCVEPNQLIGYCTIYEFGIKLKMIKFTVMKVVALILLGICAIHQAEASSPNSMFGGEVVISDQKIASLQKDEANFAVIKKYTNLILMRNCQTEVNQTISARYRVVQGINYTTVFRSSFGPLKIVTLTILWLKLISVSQIAFTDYGTSGQLKPKLQDFTVSDILQKQYEQLVAKNDEKYEIPELRKVCDKILAQKKSLSNKVRSTQITSKASESNNANAARKLQTVLQVEKEGSRSSESKTQGHLRI